MTESDFPTFHELMSLVVNLVPDLPEPSEIMAEIRAKERVLWLEGWCDGCIASKGYPKKGEGMLEEKLDHIRELTPRFLDARAKERGMTVQSFGFVPLSDKKFLYGVSWGIFHRK